MKEGFDQSQEMKVKDSSEFLELDNNDKILVSEEAKRQVESLDKRAPGGSAFGSPIERERQLREYRRQFATDSETLGFLRKRYNDEVQVGIRKPLAR